MSNPAIARDYRVTTAARAQRDEAFTESLISEAVSLVQSGEVDAAKMLLRSLVVPMDTAVGQAKFDMFPPLVFKIYRSRSITAVHGYIDSALAVRQSDENLAFLAKLKTAGDSLDNIALICAVRLGFTKTAEALKLRIAATNANKLKAKHA